MDRGIFLSGAWVRPEGLERAPVRNPATGEILGSTLLADAATVDHAVGAAEAAFAGFAALPASARAALLCRAADLVEARIEPMAQLLTREQGKPLADNRKEILFGCAVLRLYAGEATRIHGSIRPASAPDIRNLVTYHPVGVAGAIVPWNYPVDIYCWKIGPALAAGCPVIVKSPHETPLAIALLVDCLHEAGFPPGTIADLPGLGPVAGAALAAHPRIRVLSATASVPAGQAIMRAAAVNLKRLCLELGGHAPFVVLADADLEAAARAAHRRAFSNMGQICIAVNRILVDHRIARPFAEILADLAERTELGNGLDPGIAYGPVQNAGVIARMERHVADARARGGRVIAGGGRARGGDLDAGLFWRPTVIADAPRDSLVMREESFGPVVGMTAFHDEAELLALANGLDYGLAAYVFGGELGRAWAIAERLEFGAVGVNVNDTSDLHAPFGGWKLSGFGRELGPEGMNSYLDARHLKIRLPATGV
jgi:acyl-CoA reductase-like NAD-dependent aldehyde dehydrogenase